MSSRTNKRTTNTEMETEPETESESEPETEAEAGKSIVKAQDSALPPPPKTQARKDRDLALFLAGLIVFLMWLTS